MIPPIAWLEDPTRSDADRLAFEVHARALTATWWPRLGLVVAAATLMWWPTDAVVYPDPVVAEAIGALRLRLAVTLVAPTVILPWLPSAHPHAIVLAFLLATLNLTIMGWSLPPLDGSGVPGLAYAFIAPQFSVLLPISLFRRIFAVIVMSVAVVGAWLLSPAGDLSAPGVAASMSFLVFSCALSVFVGHMIYALLRRSFQLNLLLEREREALASLAGRQEVRLAEQAAAIEAMHTRAREAQAAHRRELAREVHDSMGQELLSLRLLVGVARQVHVEAAFSATLAELDDQLQRVQQSLRRVLEALRPLRLAEVGLVEALAGMVQELEQRSGIAVVLEARGVREPIPSPVALAVYRVTQEALSNAVRHARPRHIHVGLVQAEHRLRLVVNDDGEGVPPGGLGSGFGTVGILERVTSLGGTAVWHTDEGTRLEVEIPLPESR